MIVWAWFDRKSKKKVKHPPHQGKGPKQGPGHLLYDEVGIPSSTQMSIYCAKLLKIQCERPQVVRSEQCLQPVGQHRAPKLPGCQKPLPQGTTHKKIVDEVGEEQKRATIDPWGCVILSLVAIPFAGFMNFKKQKSKPEQVLVLRVRKLDKIVFFWVANGNVTACIMSSCQLLSLQHNPPKQL